MRALTYLKERLCWASQDASWALRDLWDDHRRRALALIALAVTTVAVTAGATAALPATTPKPSPSTTSPGDALDDAGQGDGGAASKASAAPVAAPQGAPDSAEVTCQAATIEQRAGLVVVVALPGVTTATEPLVAEAAANHVGGIMLRDDNITSQPQAAALVAGLREALGSHLVVAVDDEGGRVRSMSAFATEIPSARRLARDGIGAAYKAGAALAADAAAIGADWVFAPVADLDDGIAGGIIGDRSFGTNPGEVAELVEAFAHGLHSQGLAGTAKHFPGHGRSADTHQGAGTSTATLDQLDQEDLVPFDELIGANIDSVMVGHVSYPNAFGDLPASLNPAVYQLLRQRGFDGVAITDALGMGAIHQRWGFDTAPALALQAGADMILVNQGDQVGELTAGIVAAVEAGTLSEDRLNEAVRRVLTLRGEDRDGILCP